MVSVPQAYWLSRRRKTRPSEQVMSADLASIASDVNVYGKHEFKMVMTLDTLRQYQATGEAPEDPWHPVGVADNSEDVTPVA